MPAFRLKQVPFSREPGDRGAGRVERIVVLLVLSTDEFNDASSDFDVVVDSNVFVQRI